MKNVKVTTVTKTSGKRKSAGSKSTGPELAPAEARRKSRRQKPPTADMPTVVYKGRVSRVNGHPERNITVTIE